MKKSDVLLRELAKAPSGLVVEIGCLRETVEVDSDGWSTLYLARQCSKDNRPFISVDNNPHNVSIAKAVLEEHGLNPSVVNLKDGTVFLKSLYPERHIAFLYLDSADSPDINFEQYSYANMLPGGIIVIDDVNSYDGNAQGKGTRILEFRKDAEIVETFYGKMAIIREGG
jgi:predicted O-methyltransferase YrrM